MTRTDEPRRAGGAALAVALAMLVAGLLAAPVQPAAPARHPVVIHQVDLRVGRDAVEVEVRCEVENFYYLYPVEEEDGRLPRREVERWGRKHAEFVAEHLVLLDADGEPIAGELTETQLPEVPVEGIAATEVYRHEVRYVRRHVLSAPPAELVFFAQGSDEVFVPLEVVVVVRQEGRATPRTYALRDGQYVPLAFDWSGADVTATAPGTPVNSLVECFLYVDADAARWEVLLPFTLLEEWTGGLTGASDSYRAALARHFGEALEVKIDGLEVRPIVEGMTFFQGGSTEDFAGPARSEGVAVEQVRAGVSLLYPRKGDVREVTFAWRRLPPSVEGVSARLLVGGNEEREVRFAAATPLHAWRAAGAQPSPVAALPVREIPATTSVPLLSALVLAAALLAALRLRLRDGNWRRAGVAVAAGLVFAVAGRHWARVVVPVPWRSATPVLNLAEGMGVFTTLHRNLYRAFDYRDEDDVYDTLAESVDGELLADLYQEVRRGLLLEEAGGARCRIETVQLLSSRLEPLPPAEGAGFRTHCGWMVSGAIEHWGHRHHRTVRYEARFTVQPRDDRWKITALEPLLEEPVDQDPELLEGPGGAPPPARIPSATQQQAQPPAQQSLGGEDHQPEGDGREGDP